MAQKETITNDQSRRRKIRDVGCAEDYLPLAKLEELLKLWRDRLTANEYPADTCKTMIRMYEIRIMRQGG